MKSILNGQTVDEVKIGEKATMSKTISESDSYLFAGLTGSLNPLYLDEEYASKTPYGKRIVPEMLVAAFLPATQGNFLPGELNVHLKQHLEFKKPVYIGDTITTEIEILGKDIKKNRVIIGNKCTNQNGEVVIVGQAIVYPKKK
jgi:3-hydroxybutyryl-CoA dehydratase